MTLASLRQKRNSTEPLGRPARPDVAGAFAEGSGGLHDARRAPSSSLWSRIRDRLIIGLDDGNESIKAVACVASKTGLAVLGFNVWRRSNYKDSNGRLKSEVESWCRQFRFFRRTLVAGAYGHTIKYRYVSFPQMTPQEFQAAAVLEARSQFLQSEQYSDLHVQSCIYPHGESGGNVDGLVIAAQRPALKARRRAMAALGMRRPVFRALAQAQCRLFSDAHGAENKTRALIDLGAEFVKISIFRGMEILLVREFSLPEDQAGVSPYSLVDQEREESAADNGGFADLTYLLASEPADSNGAAGILQQDPQVLLSLDAIGDEIKLTVKYFLSNIANSVEEAWMIGGGACAQPAVNYLANALEMPIGSVSLDDGFSIRASQTIRDSLENQWPVFYSALSLAYAEFKKSKLGRFSGKFRRPVALPKWLEDPFRRIFVSKKSGPAIALTTMLALASLIVFVWKRPALTRVDSEVEHLASQRAVLDDSLFSLKLLVPGAGFERAHPQPRRQAYWARLFEDLGHHLPGDVRLRQISLQRFEENVEAEPGAAAAAAPQNRAGERITFKGTAYEYDAILQLLDRLWQIPEFEALSVESVASTFDPKSRTFDFTMSVKIYWNR